MKNKMLLIGMIIVTMALIVGFSYTNARYYSTASMPGDSDYVKTVGKISIYHPEWTYGYTGPDNGSGTFEVAQIPTCYGSIHYEVTNKVEDEINEEEISYYIRIVAEDGSNNIPIEYDVHEYNNPDNVLNLETGIGYGPFTLSANSEETQLYSIKANYNSTEGKYASAVQHLKVQMVKKRIDGKLKVIDEAPLNMEYTGKKVKITFAYYLYGSTVSVDTPKTLTIDDNSTIDFKNSEQLSKLGITLPDESEYTLHDVRGILPGYDGTATTVTIPEGYNLDGYYIEIYLVSNIKVAVQLAYYNYADCTNGVYKEISNTGQVIIVKRGTTIDFNDENQRKELGINFIEGFSFQGLSGELITNKYTDTSVTIPSTTTDLSHYIEVYMNPSWKVKMVLAYYLYGTSVQIGTSQTVTMEDNFTIDFKNDTQLSELGITLPGESDEYTIHDVRGTLSGYDGTATTIQVPEGYKLDGYYVEVYLTSSKEVAVQLAYYNYSDYTIADNGNRVYKEISNSGQTLIINRGTKIDFENETQKEELGINFPTEYNFMGLNGDLITNKYIDTSVTIPSTTTDILHYIEVYMLPNGISKVNIKYYDSSVDENNLIPDTQVLVALEFGTEIDFTNSEILSNLKIDLPSGYKFKTAYCTELDNTGIGQNKFTIPYNGTSQTYNIDVVVEKIQTIITVPVKFYNSSGTEVSQTEVNMNSEGTYDFTTEECRKLCTDLSTMTSFTIYICNQYGNTVEVGNTTTGTITVNYNKSYSSGFNLSDDGSYIYIKAWW